MISHTGPHWAGSGRTGWASRPGSAPLPLGGRSPAPPRPWGIRAPRRPAPGSPCCGRIWECAGTGVPRWGSAPTSAHTSWTRPSVWSHPSLGRHWAPLPGSTWYTTCCSHCHSVSWSPPPLWRTAPAHRRRYCPLPDRRLSAQAPRPSGCPAPRSGNHSYSGAADRCSRTCSAGLA